MLDLLNPGGFFLTLPQLNNYWEDLPMRRIYRSLLSFMKKEDGPTSVEYAVMLSLIIVISIASITALGKNSNQAYSFVGSNIKAR
jgi:pilus assembly protein Flp/PilA